MFDAEMFASHDIRRPVSVAARDEILLRVRNLFSDTEFRKSIDAATNTPNYFRERILAVKGILEGVLS